MFYYFLEIMPKYLYETSKLKVIAENPDQKKYFSNILKTKNIRHIQINALMNFKRKYIFGLASELKRNDCNN